MGLKLEKMQMSSEGRILRSVTVEEFKEPKTWNTFIGDATRLWNKAPNIIRNAKSVGIAKKEIKSFCKNLPIWFDSCLIFSFIKVPSLLKRINFTYLLTYLLTYLASPLLINLLVIFTFYQSILLPGETNITISLVWTCIKTLEVNEINKARRVKTSFKDCIYRRFSCR